MRDCRDERTYRKIIHVCHANRYLAAAFGLLQQGTSKALISTRTAIFCDPAGRGESRRVTCSVCCFMSEPSYQPPFCSTYLSYSAFSSTILAAALSALLQLASRLPYYSWLLASHLNTFKHFSALRTASIALPKIARQRAYLPCLAMSKRGNITVLSLTAISPPSFSLLRPPRQWRSSHICSCLQAHRHYTTSSDTSTPSSSIVSFSHLCGVGAVVCEISKYRPTARVGRC